jgi:F-type H+-transporting ATPase subunit epsilon
MAGAIELEIINAREVVLRVEIKDLYIPAFLGEAGVLSHHLPYLSLLKSGEISYLDLAGERHFFYSGEGFMEVRDDRITLILDTFERGEDLDEEALRKQLQESQARIRSSFQGTITPAELQVELARERELLLKLAICKKIRGK